MDELRDRVSGTGKLGEATLIAAMHMGGERGADGTEDGPLRRGSDDGETIGVGTDLFQVEPA